ncbi:MAG: hypothetical protein RI922_128 [Bacteroidota bacterium]|jgi:uncharacterized membrane protein YfcA
MEIIGYFLAVLVGISLGLVGSGGSILTVPILVLIMGIEPNIATAYSLFIVGTTAFVGGVKSILEKRVEFKTTLIFGVPSIISVYFTRGYILPQIPDSVFTIAGFEVTKSILLMVLFAIVMLAASISMIKPMRKDLELDFIPPVNYTLIFLQSILIGFITGLVGAGGGFLIIPALILFAHIPMKRAVGTSLLIITTNSAIGFLSAIKANYTIDWNLLTFFTFSSVIGIFLGFILAKKIPGEKLKRGFGWLVMIMGIYIIIDNLFLKK